MRFKHIWERPIVVLTLGVLFILAGAWEFASMGEQLDGALMLISGLVFVVCGAALRVRRSSSATIDKPR